MCKKIGIAALIVAAGVLVFSKTSAGSYMRTFWDQTKGKVSNQVSLEFEIDRIRKDIDRLIPDLRKNLGTLAQEMSTVESLREEIATTKINLEKQKVALRGMKDVLQSDVSQVVFGGRAYKAESLRERLIRDLAASQRCEETLSHKEQLLEAKERSVDAAKETLATVRGKKQELELMLAQLETEVKTLRIAQARSNIQLDDSGLARVKQSMANLQNRLRTETIEMNLNGQFATEVENIVEPKKKSNDEVLTEVEAYLNGTATKNGDRVAGKR